MSSTFRLAVACSAGLLAGHANAAPTLQGSPSADASPAQSGDRPMPSHDELGAETLFPGRVTHGGFGAGEAKVTAVLDSPALLLGIQGGWILNHQFTIGIAGYGLATEHAVPVAMQAGGVSSTLQMGYGGLRVGYLLNPRSLVHVGFGLVIGGGGLQAMSRDRFATIEGNGDTGTHHLTANAEAFFALEPDVEAEVNVTQFMRIVVSGSYRYLAAVEAPGITNWKLSAPAAGLALRFGAF